MSNLKQKVLFLIENLDDNRAAQPLSIIVQYIDKTKFDVTVCAINAGGQYESVIKENANYDKRELIIGMSAGNVITSLKAIQSASE
jgi:hypothetical protein